MYVAGDRVTYVGNIAECKGMRGVVQGPGEGPGRVAVEWTALGSVIDMSDTVLEKDKAEEVMGKSRKTTVTHPDGTVSMRASVNNVYVYAVERREDMWATAKIHREQAEAKREEKARFIAAVRAGRIAVRRDSKFYDSVVLLGEGEEWWLGGHKESEPLDRKAAVREWLANADRLAAVFDRDADKAESGPQYHYGVVRWSMSHENATKGLREFEGRSFPTSTFRVVPAEAAE